MAWDSYSTESWTLPLCPRLSTGRKGSSKYWSQGFARCSISWLYPQLVTEAYLNKSPLSCTRGFSYPYKVIHRLLITFNFSLENIFKFFQNAFPIQVYRIYNRTRSINLILSGFIKACILYYSINFVSSSHIKTLKRLLLLTPWVIHTLWITFSQLTNPSAYLLTSL